MRPNAELGALVKRGKKALNMIRNRRLIASSLTHSSLFLCFTQSDFRSLFPFLSTLLLLFLIADVCAVPLDKTSG